MELLFFKQSFPLVQIINARNTVTLRNYAKSTQMFCKVKPAPGLEMVKHQKNFENTINKKGQGEIPVLKKSYSFLKKVPFATSFDQRKRGDSKVMAEAKITKMQNYPVLELIKHSFAFTVLSYGGWHLLNDCCSSYVPVGILLTTLLTGSVLYLRVPAPSKSAVEKILGKDISEDVGVDDYVIRTIAHRGAGLDAPENTLAAFKMCKQKGCDVIEFDITLTADGVPVVFHDKTLERMADTNLNVNEHKWKDLQEINISSKHPFKDRFPVTNIPTLDDSIRQFIECGQRIFIDLKDNDSRMVGVILNLYKKFPDLYSMAVVTTFYPNLIYMLRRQDPKIVCSMAWRPHAFAYESYNFPKGRGEARSKVWYRHYFLEMCDLLHEWMLPRITYYLLGLSVILLHKDAINPKSVVDWRNKGLRVMAWTVNTPSEKQYLAKVLKITYLTDTLTGESSTHLNSSVSSL